MNADLWANYDAALKLILTGSAHSQLNSDQRTVFMNMLSQGMTHDKEHGPFKPERDLAGVNTQKHCLNEETSECETLYYIPDLFRFMVELYGARAVDTLPVSFDYLNSLSNASGGLEFAIGGSDNHQDWLDSPAGRKYWGLLCRKLAIHSELGELDKMHDGGIPSEKESLKRQRDELQNELRQVLENLEKADALTEKTYQSYTKTLNLLKARLNAKPEELAAWIFLGPEQNGLTAYTNANELADPPHFCFSVHDGDNYFHQILNCWFDADEVVTFKPKDRFITGEALIERWMPAFNNDCELTKKAIEACIKQSRLLGLHPVTGLSQWTEDDIYPSKESALFMLSSIQAIENEDGLLTKLENTDPEVGTPEWRSQNARKAINTRHDKPGGSRDKQEQIRKIWASGKYSTRDICAEEECAALNISFSAARKALRNTPDQ